MKVRERDQATLTVKVGGPGERATIEKRGNTIGLGIGDQVSDAVGGVTAGRFVVRSRAHSIP